MLTSESSLATTLEMNINYLVIFTNINSTNNIVKNDVRILTSDEGVLTTGNKRAILCAYVCACVGVCVVYQVIEEMLCQNLKYYKARKCKQ